MRLEVIPFKPAHAVGLTLRAENGKLFDSAERLFDTAICFSRMGPTFTGMYGGEVVGVAGIIRVHQGLGEAWSMMTPLAAKIPKAFHRAVSQGLKLHAEQMRLRRLQVVVSVEDERSALWIERLGFEIESVMEKWGPEGADYLMLKRIL